MTNDGINRNASIAITAERIIDKKVSFLYEISLDSSERTKEYKIVGKTPNINKIWILNWYIPTIKNQNKGATSNLSTVVESPVETSTAKLWIIIFE